MESLDNESELSKPIEEMFSEILAKNIGDDGKGTDNMTAILVYFHDNIKAQWFDLSGSNSVDTENLEQDWKHKKVHLDLTNFKV